jgi:D-3-phosphoglycerate dehydrogenase
VADAATSRPLVIIAEELDAEPLAWLGERCAVEACLSNDSGQFDGLLHWASGLVVRTYARVDAGLLARAPRLRVVGRAGVGLDNIDIPACRSRGVEVVHTPDANTRAVVELAWAMLFDALRPRVYLDRALPLGEWKRLRHGLIAPKQLAGMTIGIVGFGRVGRAMARVAAAMEMRVIYNDLLEIPEGARCGGEPMAPEEVFRGADIVTIHIDDRPSNARFIGERLVRRLRPDAVFVNASRGFVVDSAALASWLRANPSATAILDVHDPEPFGPDYPLLGLPNARLTPHLGAATAAAHRNMSWVVRDVWRVLSGERPMWPAPG